MVAPIKILGMVCALSGTLCISRGALAEDPLVQVDASTKTSSVGKAAAAAQAPIPVIFSPSRANDPRNAGLAPAGELGGCMMPSAPPVTISTVSKYDQDVATKSVVSSSANRAREQVLKPIRAAVKQLGALAAPSLVVDSAYSEQNAACATNAVRVWAEAASLTRMETSDAYLSRDRFVADVGAVLISLRAQGMDLSSDPKVRNWLTDIAQTTITFYDWEAGPKSRSNNHRYWAGLAVGSIGYFLNERPLVDWAKTSFRVGVCQVDGDGFLPLELARGSKALDYHLFALRPLVAFANMAETHGESIGSECGNGLARLQALARDSMSNDRAFVLRTGVAQDAPSSDKAFPVQFRLSTLGVLVGAANVSLADDREYQ
jgi:Alginate lyase